MKITKNIYSLFLAIGISLGLTLPVHTSTAQAAPTTPSITYQAHVQNAGWLPISKDGMSAGQPGSHNGIEAIAIKIQNSPYKGGVTYTSFQPYNKIINPKYNDSSPKEDGAILGSTGKNIQFEALMFKLYGDIANHYDLYARAYSENIGWLSWKKTTKSTTGGFVYTDLIGTYGLNKKLEDLQLILVKKGATPPKITGPGGVELPYISSQSSIQNTGWENMPTMSNYVYSGTTIFSGTIGKSLQLNAIKFSLFYNNDKYFTTPALLYRTHVSNHGWLPWVNDSVASGSSSNRIEAFELKLQGNLANFADVYYRAHIQGSGWQPWVKNGQTSGTTGKSLRLEAYQVYIVYKNGPAPKY